MKAKLLNEDAQRTFAVVFDTGDEVLGNLLAFAREHKLCASEFTGLGAFSDVVLGFFDWQDKDYKRIPVAQQVEVVSLVGNLAFKGDEPKLHAHVVVAAADGHALGGHLLEAHVRPTLELVVTESRAHLRREIDEETGLALIRL